MMIANMPLTHGGSRTNKPSRVVVHAMAEYIEQGGRDFTAYELLDRLGLSAHALVTPSGVVIRCRDDDEHAYHAKGHNRNSLGVEVLVPGVHTYTTFLEAMKTEWVSDEQYVATVELVKSWVDRYHIGETGVVRHLDIDPGRKHDPGDGFPWDSFVKGLFA